MGTKDITEKHLVEHNDVFADIANVLLFKGRQVVKAQELENESDHSIYKADGEIHEQERDVAKLWIKGNTTISVLGLEHQTQVDRYMPLRVISYDGSVYRAQLDKKGKRYPVVTMILHFGTEKRWNGPQNLRECLAIPEEMDAYINDYKIYVFDIAFLSLEQVNLFRSDFRIVADYFVQLRMNAEYMPSKKVMKHIDAVLKLMSVLTNDTRFEVVQNGKEKVKTMCEVLDRAESRGEERANALTQILLETNRIEDLKKALADATYRKKLMKELLPDDINHN